MPEWTELALRIAGGASALVAAPFMWVYWRRLAVDAAQKKLNELQARALDTVQHEMASYLRTIELREERVQMLEKQHEDCLAALDEAKRQIHQDKLAIERWEAMTIPPSWEGDPEL